MANSVLLEAVKRTANQFQTLLNNNRYLFEGTPGVAEPTLSQGGTNCFLYIPGRSRTLTLTDNLGIIGGKLSYRLNGKAVELFQYSFHFEHANTFIEFQEGEDSRRNRYRFHYDMDKDAKNDFIHPLCHIQIAPLTVPRFQTVEYDNEIAMFVSFLKMIEKSFYTNSASETQTPKLKCAHEFLTQYQ